VGVVIGGCTLSHDEEAEKKRKVASEKGVVVR